MKKDYYSVLVRALSALDPNNADSRRGVYDRARRAIIGAPLTVSEIRQERSALEAAIEKIEAEFSAVEPAAPPLGAATDQVRDEDIEAPPHAPVAKSIFRRKSSWLLASGVAAATLLVAAFFVGTRSRAPIIPQAKAPIQAPAGQADRVTADANEGPSYIFKRQLVYYRSVHPAGTIVINKSQKFLYLIRPNTAAMRYTIGIGKECSDIVGLLLVSAKEDWSGATVVASKKETPQSLQAVIGRFGARSLALSDTGYRIHGNDGALSDRVVGCIPLVNEDVIDLYERVNLGTKVVMN